MLSPENTKKLFDAFPHLYRGRDKPQESSMHWGFECGDGWFDLLWKLSQTIEDEARKLGLDAQGASWPEVFQVKHKGGLCFYLEHTTPAMNQLIEETKKSAQQTCEVCGAQGAQAFYGLRSSKVLCGDHAGLAPNNNFKGKNHASNRSWY